MLNVINQLKKILEKNRFGEKILITPSFAAGREFLEGCARQRVGTLNLRVETISSLAEQICNHELYEKNLISVGLEKELLLGVLKRLKAQGKLVYFAPLEVTPGVGKAIYQSIVDLKLAGLSPDDLTENMFPYSPLKKEDISKVWLEYDRELEINNWLDRAGLLNLASSKDLKYPGTMFIVPSNLSLSFLEKTFFKEITNDHYEVIYFGRPRGTGVMVPQTSLEKELEDKPDSVTEGNTNPYERMLWVNDIDNAPTVSSGQAKPVEMFYAYGESNEVREVLGLIKKKIETEKLTLDQAVVYYTTKEPYTTLFYTLAQEYNLPVSQGNGITFGQGIDFSFTKPGKLFYALLEWVKDGFKVTDFINFLESGLFRITDKNAPASSVITRLLRDSSIGWGKERYVKEIIKELEKQQKILSEQIVEHVETSDVQSDVQSGEASQSEDTRKKNIEKLQTITHHLQWTAKFFEKLFADYPQADEKGELSYKEFASWIEVIVEEYSSVTSKVDADVKKMLQDELKLIGDSVKHSLNCSEAYTSLKALFEGRRVFASGPKPGALHVDHFNHGLWIDRSCVFVIGLDANRFPGSVKEDPILLDVERKKISSSMPLDSFFPKEKAFEFIQFLSGINGSLTLSYSFFDPVGNREVFPAAILLQMYRLQTGDLTADYDKLAQHLGKRKDFVPVELEKALDESSWWLNRIFSGKTLNKNFLKEKYANIYNGLDAKNHRDKNEMTEFDGQACAKHSVDDIHKMVMSSSRLETLAKCPFRYFLQYILQVKPTEVITMDPNTWLDAKTTGSLYHSIFERFYKGLTEREEKPSLAKHREFLDGIINEHINEKKHEIPPPNEPIFESEVRAIRESCLVFLKAEEKEIKESTPKYFELSFGGTEDDFKPVSIELPNGKGFLLRGIIDRVDLISSSNQKTEFKVWDYKSGKGTGYSDKDYFQGGRQLQHALYSIALEKILQNQYPNPNVIESGYIFPTLKGEGKRIIRERDYRDNISEILNILLTILEKGTFSLTDDSSDCQYCDFSESCNRKLYSTEALVKFKDSLEGLRKHG